MPSYYTLVSILLALLVVMVGIRSLAETDWDAGSGLGMASPFSDYVFSSHPHSWFIRREVD